MAQVTRQLHRPFETPYEGTVHDAPAPVFGPRPVTSGALAFRLGRLKVELPGTLGSVIDRPVDYGLVLEKYRQSQGIVGGGIQRVGPRLPAFFHRPDPVDLVDVPLPASNKVATVHYEDFAGKHPDLASPYELTIVVEMICASKEIAALPPAIQARIYDDLLNSGFDFMQIDPENYLRDAEYSAGNDTQRRLNAETYVTNPGYLEPGLIPLAHE